MTVVRAIMSANGPSPRGRGNHLSPQAGGGFSGPSPRGRGNPVVADDVVALVGSIPAWAGKPIGYHARKPVLEVHPRVGGETRCRCARPSGYSGPSPRGRGNPPFRGTRSGIWRSHPRVGGETRTRPAVPDDQRGPSPRGRGNQTRHRVPAGRPRSIPAWAGKPCRPLVGHPDGRVHPRVGGETQLVKLGLDAPHGPSPRGRGNHECRLRFSLAFRSIPAWAGKPAQRRQPSRIGAVHPRVGGETQGASLRS